MSGPVWPIRECWFFHGCRMCEKRQSLSPVNTLCLALRVWLVAGSEDGTLWIWGTKEEQPILPGGGNNVVFSDDGELIASTGWGKVELFGIRGLAKNYNDFLFSNITIVFL